MKSFGILVIALTLFLVFVFKWHIAMILLLVVVTLFMLKWYLTERADQS